MKYSSARPSPALVIAVLALVFAMVGSAIAGTDGLSSKITKSKVKKIANKQINKAAPGLSVNHANTADTANSAKPSGPAGGDLTGTYPDPTVGADTINQAKLADDSVGQGELQDNSVGTGELQDNAVTTTKIADNAVTGAKVNEATLDLGLTRVSASSASNSVSPKSATATCPAGTKLVGTGWANDGGQVGDNKEILADEVVPNGNLTAVSVTSYETDSIAGNWTTSVIAICARVAG